MTLALALATGRTRFGLSITLIEDLPLVMVIMAALALVLSGLVIDLGTGWPVGTATLAPAEQLTLRKMAVDTFKKSMEERE